MCGVNILFLQMSGDQGVSAFPDGDNLFSWVATIHGAAETMYDKLSYKLTLRFPSRYPYVPPTVKFSTPCFHPNVDEYGNICLDILKVRSGNVFTFKAISGVQIVASLLCVRQNFCIQHSNSPALFT